MKSSSESSGQKEDREQESDTCPSIVWLLIQLSLKQGAQRDPGSLPPTGKDALNQLPVLFHGHWPEAGGPRTPCAVESRCVRTCAAASGAEAGRARQSGAVPALQEASGDEKTGQAASWSTGASSGSCRREKALPPLLLTISASFRARETTLSSFCPASPSAEATKVKRG